MWFIATLVVAVFSLAFFPAVVFAQETFLFGDSSNIKLARSSTQKGKLIEINLANQKLSMVQDGKVLGTYIISSGKASMPTPRGTFQIQNKARRAWSEKYGLYMPYWMAFTPSGSYGIHELPEWPGGYKEGANHLGTPVSHGCVRLGIGPAKRLYDWAETGTPVIIR